MIITPNQTRGACPEDPRFEHNHCKTDKDCIPGEAVINGNGMLNYLFIVIENCFKSKSHEESHNQFQFTFSSHLLRIRSDNTIDRSFH